MGNLKSIRIEHTDLDFEREPLIRPFGFKGGYLTEIWQSAALLGARSGKNKIGLCSQSVLWSDAEVFRHFSESGGNALMYATTAYALSLIKGMEFDTPVHLLDAILEEVYSYAKMITGHPELRKTFALNALAGVDNAVWMIFAEENGLTAFDDMIPAEFKSAFSYRHEKVACVPMFSYSVPVSEIRSAAEEGYYFMKIKLGMPGTQEQMLEHDKARLKEIHHAVGHYQTSHTEDGKIRYYLDANGRYMKKETLLKLIEYAVKIGAFDQIALIEEPFPEELELDVSDIPVCLAADESAHTDRDALIRIQMGYRFIALKAVAKTLSMTMKIARVAAKENVSCFCADLTVNPILVDWNKNVAARVAPVHGFRTGLLEMNGNQNYKNWQQMELHHPFPDATWRKTDNGIFNLDSFFYSRSGGIYEDSKHYREMFDL